MRETIFALFFRAAASGDRCRAHFEGARAGEALKILTVKFPRRARRRWRACAGRDSQVIDQALVLWFPAPHSETVKTSPSFSCMAGGRS